MTRQIKKSILASAVAASMGVAGAAWGYGDDSILFPYVVKSSSVTTLLTIINRSWDEELHLTWLYKTPGTVTSEKDQNQLNCKHFDNNIPTSKNDIITFDAGRVFGDDQFVLFNDPGAGPDHKGYDGYTAPGVIEETWIGQLIVDTDTELLPGGDEDLSYRKRDRLFGEAMVFEYGAGAAWGYLAYNAVDRDVFDFRAENARNGEVLTSESPPVPIDIVPMAESVQLVERLFVTPVGEYQNGGGGEQKLSVKVVLGKEQETGDLWYNRNEVPASEPVAANVVCVGRITIKDYLSNSLKAHLVDGGWGDVNITEGNSEVLRGGIPYEVKAVDEAIVQKLEYNTGNAYFPGATGIWNTAVWLRDMSGDKD
jgi:hypothetical protein